MEEYLQKTVQMFSYLTDKDLFAEIYRWEKRDVRVYISIRLSVYNVQYIMRTLL